MFGTLARLGLDALTSYEGQSVFPLAWVQATGCLVMGSHSPPLYTAMLERSPLLGFCGSLTTFSSWNLDMFLAFSNASGLRRIWLCDVGITFARPPSHETRSSFPPRQAHAPQRIISTLSIASYILTTPLYFILSRTFRPQATSALLFAFPGTLTRYILSGLGDGYCGCLSTVSTFAIEVRALKRNMQPLVS
ncbi:uncharacterized protein EI90DRAFT_3143730 [Cantharellus anzutake]|uniref:uncharacterized protein n=1 Tax=Cantharellus anzutake TaxID=1750568 RepID=UPI001905CFF8|nr:uncharacterized protein EI90DRAFT_3143730 [Cantharellus anzutake]KAF8341444.1 hypothetical protein EI90DRAFT_3143730 [Cantharellus anzutake]